MTLHLSRDVDALHHDILLMCATVEEMIHHALDLLDEPDVDAAEDLIVRDDEIDRWDVRIEEECLKILALHQPVAIDLRRITTVLKISNELERVADLGVHIAERARELATRLVVPVPDKLKQMGKLAVDMLHRSIDAYVQLDSDLARDVIADDDSVDQLNREIIDEVIGWMQDSPEMIQPLLHLFSVSRHVERVADHATNIAEDVVYLVEGEIIRHRHPVSGSGS